MKQTGKRYSDADLEEFRVLLEKKLARANEQLDMLQSQILEVSESSDGDYGQDMMDDSNTNSDVEMLNSLAIHQRKYIRELENALTRIRQKVYGICEVTGELIDKKRLLAVPTTTKSLAAKLGVAYPPAQAEAPPRKEAEEEEEADEKKEPRMKPAPRQVITRVIRKNPPQKKPADLYEEEEEEDLLMSDWNDDDDDKEVPYENMDEFGSDDSAF